jgi:site-specific DNA recombinase
MNMDKAIKYFVYARKSSEAEDRQVLSIESQVEELAKFEPNDPAQIVEAVTESKSAKKPGREEFNRILNAIEAGKAQGIKVWHANRLSRNSVDTGRLIYLMDLGKLVEVATPGQVYRNTPQDKFLLNLFCSQAKLENDNKGVDVKRGLSKKARMGQIPYLAPAGYLNSKTLERGANITYKDPDRFELVKKMWELLLSGNYYVPEILETANSEWKYKSLKRKKSGDRPMSRSNLYRIFTNPFYYGQFEFPRNSGIWFEQPDPMITKTDFERAQILLGRQGRKLKTKRQFAYTGGLIRCVCKAQVTAEERHFVVCSKCDTRFSAISKTECPKCQTPIEQMRKPKIQDYILYHGTGKIDPACQYCRSSINQNDLEGQIEKHIDEVAINQQYYDWALKYLEDCEQSDKTSQVAIQKSQVKAAGEVDGKLDALLEMRLRGELTEEEYKVKKAKLLEQKALQGQRGANSGNAQQLVDEAYKKTFNFVFQAKSWLKNGDIKKKREILLELGSNSTLMGRILSISMPEELEIIKNGIKQEPAASARFEQDNRLINKGRTSSFEAVRPMWLGSWDSNPGPIG